VETVEAALPVLGDVDVIPEFLLAAPRQHTLARFQGGRLAPWLVAEAILLECVHRGGRVSRKEAKP